MHGFPAIAGGRRGDIRGRNRLAGPGLDLFHLLEGGTRARWPADFVAVDRFHATPSGGRRQYSDRLRVSMNAFIKASAPLRHARRRCERNARWRGQLRISISCGPCRSWRVHAPSARPAVRAATRGPSPQHHRAAASASPALVHAGDAGGASISSLRSSRYSASQCSRQCLMLKPAVAQHHRHGVAQLRFRSSRISGSPPACTSRQRTRQASLRTIPIGVVAPLEERAG